MTKTYKTSMEFVHLLNKNDFKTAYNMLSHCERNKWDAPKLETKFHGMHAYCPGPVLSIDWIDVPDSDPNWFYIAVCGDDFNEAVSGIVDSDGMISEIDFGRP